MATVASLRAHLIDELADLLNAEEQLVDALPKMAERSSSPKLRAAFERHLSETRTHVERLAEGLKLLGEPAAGKTCEAMKGLLEEGHELMGSGDSGSLLDAMLITAAQKVEHYEIASYGTVRTYAEVLGERGVARLLAQTLKEEKAADKKLSDIARGSLNKRAAKEWHKQQEAGLLERSAAWVGSAVGAAIGRVASDSQPREKAARQGARTKSRRDRAADSRPSTRVKKS
jgi:ferritin-like metal-binding protein YciE